MKYYISYIYMKYISIASTQALFLGTTKHIFICIIETKITEALNIKSKNHVNFEIIHTYSESQNILYCFRIYIIIYIYS